MAQPENGDQALKRAFNDADESINVTVGGAGVTLEAGDIEIGAVELKDGATDNRAKIDAAAALLAASMLLGVHDPTVGLVGDAEVAGAGDASLVAVMKRLRTLLNGGLPAALAAGGGLKVEGVAGGVVVPVDSELPAALAMGDTMANPTAPAVLAHLMVYNAGVHARVATPNSNGDATGLGAGALTVGQWGFIGNGSQWDRVRLGKVFKPLSAVNVNAEATIWTPTASRKFRLMGGVVTTSVDGNVTLKDNTAGTTIAVIPCKAGQPTTFDFDNGILSAAANNVLTATGPAASTLSGTIYGTEE